MIYIAYKDTSFSIQLFDRIKHLSDFSNSNVCVRKNPSDIDYNQFTNIKLLFVEADCITDLERAEAYKNSHSKTQIVIYTDSKILIEKGYHYDFFRVVFKENLLDELVELRENYLEKVRNTILELPTTHGLVRVKLKDIDYMMAKGNYVYFCLNGEVIKIRSSLSKFLDKILKHSDFLLIDRAVYLNFNKIKSINYKEQFVILINEHKLYCSRSGIQNIKEYLSHLDVKEA